MANCVICYSELKSEKAVLYEDAKVKELESQLNVIFILKQIFEVEPNQIEIYSQKWGDPENWMKLCSNCHLDVTTAEQIFWKCRELARKFDQTKNDIQEKIRNSEEAKEANVGSRITTEAPDVVSECRRTFCLRQCREIPAKSAPVKEEPLGIDILLEDDDNPSQFLIVGSDNDTPETGSLRDYIGFNFDDDQDQTSSVQVQPDVGPNPVAEVISAVPVPAEVKVAPRKRKRVRLSKKADADPKDEPEPEDPSVSVALLKPKARPPYKLDPSKVTLSSDKSSGSCNICGKAFSTVRKLRTHVQRIHDRYDECNCTICGTTYASTRALKRHMVTIHKIGSLKIQCGQCEESFDSKEDLRLHKKSMHSEDGAVEMALADRETLSCKQCDRTFKNANNLRLHIHQVHLRKFEQICSICGKKMLNSRNMRKHMAVIHGIGTWDYKQPPPKKPRKKESTQCYICGKTIGDARHLNKHVQSVHEDQRPHECDICKKAYRGRCDLMTHKARIHNIGDFKCDFEGCSKVFWKEKFLLEHKKEKHEVEVVMHPCRFCSKSFRNTYNLKTHEQRHVNLMSKPIPCDLCDSRFATIGDMRKHLTVKHKIKLKPLKNSAGEQPTCPSSSTGSEFCGKIAKKEEII